MEREKELKKIIKIIKDFFGVANCGLFNTRNIIGDRMDTLFEGEYFKLDICFNYAYFEVFGTNEQEFKILENMYERLRRKQYE